MPLVDLIYLDSAHEAGETRLELNRAWAILAPGGILYGDDFDKYWPGVHGDVSSFAKHHTDETHRWNADELPAIPSGVWRPFEDLEGLLVETSAPAGNQWLIKKRA